MEDATLYIRSVPRRVKTAFKRAVAGNETDMTAVIVALMTDYAIKHGEKVSDE